MKRISFKLISLLFVASFSLKCARESFFNHNHMAPRLVPESWAGSPEDYNRKPFEYFYIQSSARLNTKEVATKNN